MNTDTLVSRYNRAMIRGDLNACIRLEKEYNLFGYLPELVTKALAMVDNGEEIDFDKLGDEQ